MGFPGYFARVSIELLTDKRLKGLHIKIVCCLDLYGFTLDRGCWPSRKTLASDCGVSVSQISRATNSLKRWGYIEIERRDLNPNKRLTAVYRATPEVGIIYFTKGRRFWNKPNISQDGLESYTVETETIDPATVTNTFRSKIKKRAKGYFPKTTTANPDYS